MMFVLDNICIKHTCVDVHVDVHVVMGTVDSAGSIKLSDSGSMFTPSSRDLSGVTDQSTLAPEVRAYLTGKLSTLLDSLEPYVDGTFELTPRMTEVYLKALRELGLLFRVYDRPVAKPGEDGETIPAAVALEMARTAVVAQLEELSRRQGGQEYPRPALTRES